MQTKLNGSGFILASLIVLIVGFFMSLSFLLQHDLALPAIILLSMVDIILVSLCFAGYLRGSQGWALFAIIYGVLSIIFGLSSGDISIAGILLMIGGIIGYEK